MLPLLSWAPNSRPHISLSKMQTQQQRAKDATKTQPQQQTQPSPAPAHPKELTWPDSCPKSRTRMDESPASSLRSEAPEKPSVGDGGGAVVAVETYYSPLQSPLPITPPTDAATPDNFPAGTATNSSLAVAIGRVIGAETTPSALVVGSVGGGGGGGVFGGRKWKNNEGVVEGIVSRSRKKVVLVRTALGFRVCEFVVSLISFVVMAADNTQGWSGDSFYRYKEYRYCLSVNFIAFAYAAFQACRLTYNMVSGKQFIKYKFHYQFDFLMDQILAYLLISAASAAASRIDDWQSNWGKDEFTEKASISASMSFLAFIGFALSSLISGYNLCNRDFT